MDNTKDNFELYKLYYLYNKSYYDKNYDFNNDGFKEHFNKVKGILTNHPKITTDLNENVDAEQSCKKISEGEFNDMMNKMINDAELVKCRKYIKETHQNGFPEIGTLKSYNNHDDKKKLNEVYIRSTIFLNASPEINHLSNQLFKRMGVEGKYSEILKCIKSSYIVVHNDIIKASTEGNLKRSIQKRIYNRKNHGPDNDRGHDDIESPGIQELKKIYPELLNVKGGEAYDNSKLDNKLGVCCRTPIINNGGEPLGQENDDFLKSNTYAYIFGFDNINIESDDKLLKEKLKLTYEIFINNSYEIYRKETKETGDKELTLIINRDTGQQGDQNINKIVQEVLLKVLYNRPDKIKPKLIFNNMNIDDKITNEYINQQGIDRKLKDYLLEYLDNESDFRKDGIIFQPNEKLLQVAMFFRDKNSYIGNGYYNGILDPEISKLAGCSCIAELLNPLINPYILLNDFNNNEDWDYENANLKISKETAPATDPSSAPTDGTSGDAPAPTDATSGDAPAPAPTDAPSSADAPVPAPTDAAGAAASTNTNKDDVSGYCELKGGPHPDININVAQILGYINEIDQKIVDAVDNDGELLVSHQVGKPHKVNLADKSNNDMTQQCFWMSLLQGLLSSRYGDKINDFIKTGKQSDLIRNIRELAKKGKGEHQLKINKNSGEDMDIDQNINREYELTLKLYKEIGADEGELIESFGQRLQNSHTMGVINLLNKIQNNTGVKIIINIYPQSNRGTPNIEPVYLTKIEPTNIDDFHSDIQSYINIVGLEVVDMKGEVIINIIQYNDPKHFQYIIKYVESNKDYKERLIKYKNDIQGRLDDIRLKNCEEDINLYRLKNKTMMTWINTIDQTYQLYKGLKDPKTIESNIDGLTKIDGAIDETNGTNATGSFFTYESGELVKGDLLSEEHLQELQYKELRKKVLGLKDLLTKGEKESIGRLIIDIMKGNKTHSHYIIEANDLLTKHNINI